MSFSPTPCGTYGFLFTKVSLNEPAVVGAFAAFSVIESALPVLGLLLILSKPVVPKEFLQKLRESRSFDMKQFPRKGPLAVILAVYRLR